MKVAVIYFPGTNDDGASKLAAEAAGLNVKIVRWNDTKNLHEFDCYILPGGWSYEDRIRAGVIAAKNKVMEIIKQEAAKGKLVLGICNGAQILVEAGMIPGLKGRVEMALAPNRNPKISGYYCTWTNVKATNGCRFIKKGAVLPIPIAHGEGRFTTSDEVLEELKKNNQMVFQYCDSEGTVKDEFPINPNGSTENIAGICNKEGNVLAMMPHPERCSWMRQLPDHMGNLAKTEEPAPCRVIFENIAK